MTALDRVRAVLDERNIPHALIGAAALAAHGVALDASLQQRWASMIGSGQS